MQGHQPPIWKKRSVFFLPLCWESSGGERDGTWDRSHLLLTLDPCALPCHSSWDFQLFHFIYFRSLLPRFSPPRLLCSLSWSFICTSHGPATWHYFKWKCNFKPSCCRSGCSAFGAKRFAVIQTNLHRCSCKSERALPIHDRFHGWPGIHSKTAWGPSIWSEPARQNFTSKLHRRRLWPAPQHRALCSDAPKESFKTHFIIRQWEGWKDTPGNENMGWGGEGRVPVVCCASSCPAWSIQPRGGLGSSSQCPTLQHNAAMHAGLCRADMKYSNMQLTWCNAIYQ